MEMCRACLSTGVGMIPMDDIFVDNYNILTNLNVALSEDTPLYTCSTCYNGAVFCIEFRKKCVASDQTLKEILFLKTADDNNFSEPEVKVEENVTPKLELKLEYDEINDDYSDECYINDDDEYLIELKKEKEFSLKSTKKSKSLTAKKPKLNKKEHSTVQCGLCSEKLKDMEGLTKHLESHKGDTACCKCQQHFISWLHVLSHRIDHLPPKDKRCHICTKLFQTASNFEFHLMRVHELAEKDANIQCKMCPSMFTSGRKLYRHILYAHAPPKIKCEICGKGFGAPYLLKAHKITHSSDKIYECDLCDYNTKWKMGLKKHMLGRHTEGRVYCQTCGTVFMNKERLDKHTCKSQGSICPICGISLIKKAARRHMKSHDETIMYKCEICPSKFKTKPNFRIHMDKHQGKPRFKCEHCQREFYSPNVLVKHRRTHTGERPYVCHICSRGFTGNHNLKLHMKVHGLDLIKKKNAVEA